MSTRGHNILDGMEELMLSLVRKHCNSEQWGSWLKVILQGAAKEGDTETVSALLEAGASASGGRQDGLTPLHSAVQGGSLDVVAKLLKTSARRDVNEKTQAGETPLHFAVEHGHADVAMALVRAGGDVNLADARKRSSMMIAAVYGRAELVKDLLLSGANINACDENGSQALDLCVLLRHRDVVKVLLQAGASPSARGEDNSCPVDWAVAHRDTGILSDMLASGPDIISGEAGVSSMWTAVRNGHAEAIDVLIDAGVDPSPNPGKDRTTMHLHTACLHLQPGSVEALLRRNVMENVRDKNDNLPSAVVGHGFPEERRDTAVVEDIQKMLTRAPADRVWRRWGWLVMLNARKRVTETEQHRREGHQGEAEDDQQVGAEPTSVLSSRRKLADGRTWATGDALHVHPSCKRFRSIVTNLIDVADELVIRRVVSYL